MMFKILITSSLLGSAILMEDVIEVKTLQPISAAGVIKSDNENTIRNRSDNSHSYIIHFKYNEQ